VFFLSDYLAYWMGFICLVAVLVMGTLWWRFEDRLYIYYKHIQIIRKMHLYSHYPSHLLAKKSEYGMI